MVARARSLEGFLNLKKRRSSRETVVWISAHGVRTIIHRDPRGWQEKALTSAFRCRRAGSIV